jgi:hypothetical protein
MQAQINFGYLRAVLDKKVVKYVTRETHIKIHHTDHRMSNVLKTGAAKRAGPSSIRKVLVEGETVSMHDDSLHGEDKTSLDPPSDSVEEATAAHGLLPQQDLLPGSMPSIPRQTSSSLPRQDTAADLLLRQEVAVSQLAPELVSKPRQVSAATPSLGLSGAAVGVKLDGGNVHDRSSFGALYSPKQSGLLASVSPQQPTRGSDSPSRPVKRNDQGTAVFFGGR